MKVPARNLQAGRTHMAEQLTVRTQFRRSLKSDGSNKHDSAKPVQVSIPHKDPIAIEPPKKVRATVLI